MTDRSDIEGWPEVLREIALDDRLGREVALRLSRSFGGTEVWLARNPRPKAELLKCVSRRHCEALVDLFGSGRLMIPMGPLTSTAERRQAIRRLLKAGRSHSFIARATKVHLMTVKRERQRMIADGDAPPARQMSLFG